MKTMTRQLVTIIITFIMSLSAYAGSPDSSKMPADHQAMAGKAANMVYGKVVQAMDVENYTYVEIDNGDKKYWAAGPKTDLKKGDMIAINTSMPFTDFESKSLNKKFKVIYFVSAFITDQAGKPAEPTNPHANVQKTSGTEIIKGIKKAKGGKTVAEVIKQRKQLAGKTVQLRGKVMKYTAKVMGRNWLHIQDSSGTQNLVVTTKQDVKKGDIVLVKGKVAVDKDLGYGYTYQVIVEKAHVTVE